MRAVKTAAVTPVSKRGEPFKFAERIDSTTYLVNVRFSETTRETMEDKILRLIEKEVTKIA